MIINAVRYRFDSRDHRDGQEDWTTYRMTTGTGRFRSVAVVYAADKEAHAFAEAIVFALSGNGIPAQGQALTNSNRKMPAMEVSLQISDDSGDTWVIHRKGDQVKYLRNGEAQTEQAGKSAAATFTQALMDMEVGGHDGNVDIAITQVATDKQGLFGKPYGQETGTRDQLRDVLGRQIADLANEAAKNLDCHVLAAPKMLARLARLLEPLHLEHRELQRQWQELGLAGAESEAGAANADTQINEEMLAKLQDEIELSGDIKKVAAPLLEPGISLKAMQDTLGKVDAAIVEICAVCGLDKLPAPGDTRDFRKALEAVSRLQASEKLIRATQAVRKHCELRIEPVFKSYLTAVESALSNDRQIASELESCLATLDLKLQVRSQVPTDAAARKNWFERFKGQKVDGDQVPKDETQHDLETARMAIEYAFSRLTQLGGDVEDAKRQQESALHAVDAALEELIRNHGRLKAHWATLAKQMNLGHEASDMSIAQLLKIIGYHAKLVTLGQQREEIKDKIKQFTSGFTSLERLLLKWRETTGSQKLTSLKNSSVLLAEARDVIRYMDAKQRRLTQMKEALESQRSLSSLRGFMKGRQQKLVAAWNKVFVEAEVPVLALDHPYLGELFKRANLIKALALAHGTVSKEARQPLFAATAHTAVKILVWDESKAEHHHKLELVKGLEQGGEEGGSSLVVLIAADAQVLQLLQGLGAGTAQIVKRSTATAPQAAATGAAISNNPAIAKANKSGDTADKLARSSLTTAVGHTAAASRRPASASLLEQRAQAALDILTGNNKGPGGSGRRL